MADLARLEAALVKADAAGDADGARVLAAEIRRQRVSGLGSEGANPRRELGIQPFEREAQETLSSTLPERIAANPMVRIATSAARPVLGAAALMSDADKERLAQLDAMQQRGNAALGFGAAGAAADLTGAVLSPLTLAAMKAPSVAAQTGFGALSGLTAGGDDPLAGAAAGGALGAAATLLPGGAAWAGQKARNIVDPLLPGGHQRAAARLANTAAGQNRPAILRALENADSPIPGMNPTAGQATVGANSAEFAALQKLAADHMPSKYYGPGGIEGAQNAARLEAIRKIGKTPEILEETIKARGASVDPLYATARQGQAEVSGVLAKVDDLLAKNPGNRELVREMQNIRSGLLDADGNLRSSSQELSSVLDGMKAAIANKDNAFIRGNLKELKDDLVKAIPKMAEADKTFATLSGPINRMQVGQELEKRLTSALSDDAKQRVMAFAGGIRDSEKLVDKVTGRELGDLAKVLKPAEMQAVMDVRKNLADDVLYQALASKGMSSLSREIAEGIPHLGSQGFFDPKVSFARGVINRALGKATHETMIEVAKAMENPKQLAELMKNAAPENRRQITEALRALRQVSVVVGAREIATNQ